MTTPSPETDPRHPTIAWHLLRLEQFTPQLLYAMLKLRTDVFVVEQACAYPELDGKDTGADVLHLVGVTDAQAVAACARLLPPGAGYDTPSIGRVVVAPAFRGRGLADVLMQRAVAHTARAWPGHAISLGAQAALQGWYAKHGFAATSEVYLEDGIPHIDMVRDATVANITPGP